MGVSRVLQDEFARLAAERLWVPVESTNLEEVAYVAGGTGNLWVRFLRKPGSNTKYSVYVYQYVPESVYRALLAAPSKGEFHARRIKNVYAVIPFI